MERKNQTLTVVLRQLNDQRPEDWDHCLAWATLAVNSAYCSAIGDSPFYLWFHRDPDYAQIRPSTVSKKPLKFTEEQLARRKVVYDIVRERLIESTEAGIRQRDKTAKQNKICMDDRVYIRKIRNQKGHNKLTQKFVGPYRVVSQKSPTVFKLRNLIDGKDKDVHTELIKIVKQRDVTPEEAPGSDSPFPEGDIEVTTGDTQQTVTPQEPRINNPPGQPIREPEQDEEVDRPEDQQTVEVQAHHPYRLRKRANN